MAMKFLLLIGLGLVGSYYFTRLRETRTVRQGNVAEARVVALREIAADGGGSWVLVLNYMVDGIDYTKTYRWPVKHLSGLDYGPKHDSYLGKKVRIFYDAKNPSYFVVAGDRDF